MRSTILRRWRATGLRWLAAAATAAAAAAPAQAHLVNAQHGTLNIVDGAAFMVLSVPASAFVGVDDDHDGLISPSELRAHADDIVRQVTARARLRDEGGPHPIGGVLLSLAENYQARPPAGASDVVVLGRFSDVRPDSELALSIDLFGTKAQEQKLNMTVTRGKEKQLLSLSVGHASVDLFPSAWTLFRTYVAFGVEHIVTGFDHLMFLFVVLATGWGWRNVLLALTCFTVGHALTLFAGAFGKVDVPASLVEPAIAATIVLMAALDWRMRSRAKAVPPVLRFSLIFVCALVHGLGFASALTELGLDRDNLVVTLTGFNVGIELGQLAFALAAAVVLTGIRRAASGAAVNLVLRVASIVAMSVGSIWFVQRVVQ